MWKTERGRIRITAMTSERRGIIETDDDAFEIAHKVGDGQ
jgi:hypothetical protein